MDIHKRRYLLRPVAHCKGGCMDGRLAAAPTIPRVRR